MLVVYTFMYVGGLYLYVCWWSIPLCMLVVYTFMSVGDLYLYVCWWSIPLRCRHLIRILAE